MSRSAVSRTNAVRKAANQLIPIVLIATVLMLIVLLMEQSKPGFVVGDASLSYPIEEETLSTMAAAGIMFVYPFVTLVIQCLIIGCRMKCYKLDLLVYWWDKTWCAMFVSFVFVVFSEFMKRFVGRLRPNFFASCSPSYNESLGLSVGTGLFITNYTCLDDPTGESARSFPSGHSIFAILLFSAMGYLFNTHHSGYNKVLDPTWALRVMLQALLTLIVGPAIALTRFTEYYHHWSDVLVGIILGYLAFGCLVVLEHTMVVEPGSDKGLQKTSVYKVPLEGSPEREEEEGL